MADWKSVIRRAFFLPDDDLDTEVQRWKRLVIPDDIQPVLAALYGFGPNKPRLVQVDDQGRLVISQAQSIGPTVKIQDGVGAQLASVTSGFAGDGTAFGDELVTAAQQYIFNGVNSQLRRSASAANLGAASGVGAGLATPPGMAISVAIPAVGGQASATLAAGAAGVRHICWGIVGSLVNNGGAAFAGRLVLRDGASGVGPILWAWDGAITATQGDKAGTAVVGWNIPGSPATQMTLEFTAAPGANNIETLTLLTYDVS